MRNPISTRTSSLGIFVAVLALVPATALAGAATGLNATAGSAGISGIGGGSIESVVGRVIGYVVGFTGIIFMGLVIYAGFLYMTAAGNQEKVGKAKQMLAAGVIGLAIVTGAYYITEAVFQAYGTATQAEAAVDEG